MPQFEPANFLPQFVWLVLVFGVLYFGIVGATLPKLGRAMAAREGKVAGDINAAEHAKGESDGIHHAYEAEMAEAHARAHTTVADAKADVIRETQGRLAAAGVALEAKAAEAAAGLDRAHVAALSEVERIAAEAAGQIVERLSGGRPDDEAVRSAVRGALAA
jgi:F-type H+-transporting ATPase subunit b